MSDEWDFYFARLNDAVASIFVDLGLRAEAPLESHPWMLWVWVTLQQPRADGLSSGEEAPRLNEIGAALDAAISGACGAQLVGRVTGGGRREFYFYGAEPGGLDEAAARALQDFEGYTFETGSAFQPEWDHYLNLLYPSASNLERMRNRRLLEALEADGDVHEIPRKVDHFLQFADAENRGACRDMLAEIGFTIEDEGASEEEGDEMPYFLVVSRVDSIEMHSINGITLELARFAGEHGGDYDGWGCEATSEAPEEPPGEPGSS